jgi:hypothetical protein
LRSLAPIVESREQSEDTNPTSPRPLFSLANEWRRNENRLMERHLV